MRIHAVHKRAERTILPIPCFPSKQQARSMENENANPSKPNPIVARIKLKINPKARKNPSLLTWVWLPLSDSNQRQRG